MPFHLIQFTCHDKFIITELLINAKNFEKKIRYNLTEKKNLKVLDINFSFDHLSLIMHKMVHILQRLLSTHLGNVRKKSEMKKKKKIQENSLRNSNGI